ncbi:membrane protein insertase YidC [Bacillus sp. PS06]|uniref:membrane protein insertase YidC n=1 Tax=Bacillus sp. PS06 TaxID=2764176 RepID=UPI00177F2D79|nr:membrane protein insertase YidC [Bacillus sp. PS06]MBD8067386.1 membrane protein insertase YidC [Bacillus sp. PS06]
MTGCSQQGSNDPSYFQTYLVHPMESLIQLLAKIGGGNFGVAIILITIIIRLVLMPLMLKQYKNQQIMKEKMAILKPEMDSIQAKLKATKDPKEQKDLQQEMMKLYQKHNVNPLSMGCLPLIIQMPILMALYYAISHSTEIGLHSFLWFSLGQSDLLMTLIAGVIYFLQFKVSQSNLTIEQQKQMRFMGLLSPIMIVVISFNAPAALPLYWCVGGLFLIGQTMLGQRLYKKKETAQEDLQLN